MKLISALLASEVVACAPQCSVGCPASYLSSLSLPSSPSPSPSLSLASEESAAELKEAILAKVGTITDVVASIGDLWMKGPILDQTLEEFRKARPLSSSFACLKVAHMYSDGYKVALFP